jgi:hypothetical protein
MLKTQFDKLSHAIRHGKTREIGEAMKEIRRLRATSARLSAATIKLASVYDSAKDCLESFHTLDIGHSGSSIGLVGHAIMAPDGDTLLHASAQLLDTSKENTSVSGAFFSRGLADRYDGQFITVATCVLTLDVAGNVALIDVEEEVAISAPRGR